MSENKQGNQAVEFTPLAISKHFVEQFQELHYDLDEAVALTTVEDIFEQYGLEESEEYDLDDTLSPQGRGILMSLIGFNLPWITSVKPSFVGTLTKLVQDGISLKFQMLNAKGVVTRTAGDITELGGDISSTKLLAKRFALLHRNQQEEHVAGTTSYSFDLKSVATDATNYPMKKGVNSVTVAGLRLDDYEADSSSKLSKRYKTAVKDDGVTEYEIEAIFDYANGTIEVNFTVDEPDVGAMVAFKAGLNTDKLDDIVGAISVSVFPTGFVANDICLDIAGNLFDVREMGAMGIPARQIASLLSSSKIDNEITYALMLELMGNGKLIAGVVDVKNAPETTIADRYSNALKAILNAHSQITIASGEEGRTCVVGGGAVYDILNSLATPNSGGNSPLTRPKGKNRGIRLLKVFQEIEFYYMPEFDELYPIDANGDSMLCVTNAPSDNLKKPVLTGVGLPLAPDNPDINSLEGSKVSRLAGSVVIETNPTERLNDQVRFLKIKL